MATTDCYERLIFRRRCLSMQIGSPAHYGPVLTDSTRVRPPSAHGHEGSSVCWRCLLILISAPTHHGLVCAEAAGVLRSVSLAHPIVVNLLWRVPLPTFRSWPRPSGNLGSPSQGYPGPGNDGPDSANTAFNLQNPYHNSPDWRP